MAVYALTCVWRRTGRTVFDIRVRHWGKSKTRPNEKQAAGISAGTLEVTEVTVSGFFHKYTVDPSFFILTLIEK